MADEVRVTNWPAPSGSYEAIALELWKCLRKADQSANEQLAFFVTCRKAAYGTAPS